MLKKSLLAVFILLCACAPRVDITKEFALQRISFSDISGWKSDAFDEALPALLETCKMPKSPWDNFCKGLSELDGASNKTVRKYIEKTLVPYQVYTYGDKKGTFTGYYEVAMKGSVMPSEKNRVPVYGMPDDLVFVNLKRFGITADKMQFVGKNDKGTLVPYPTRDEIENTIIDAPILIWIDDPVDAFLLHIQGSGRVETEDGVIRIGYAGNNGHDFVGIGSLMKKAGLLQNNLSMPAIRDWLRKNPEQGKEIMAQNPRYIFFKILSADATGPLGAMGIPLTAERSLAVDTNFIPLGTPLFLDTYSPDGKKIKRLVVAQDVGSAIKGPIRGDYFWGYGEDAFQNAGRMKSSGSYVLLWPKGKLPPTK
ncbi:MAG: MltA domain-containing protein [Alphaproteobacteria bacterium]|nr:MltA domain-containing protein [Alphaproteobacteria bacterium]